MKFVLVLTASIDPKGCVNTKRSDVSVRENDYLTSIRQWKRKKHKAVFCENSGHPLDNLTRAVKGREDQFEFLQFDGQSYPRSWGKSYGELSILKYVAGHSRLVNEADYLVKVTGRYFVKNLDSILKMLHQNKEVFAVVSQCNTGFLPSRVFICKKAFLTDYLFTYEEQLAGDNGVYFEHVLKHAVDDAIDDGHHCIYGFSEEPMIAGYDGTLDRKFRHGPADYVSMYLKRYFPKGVHAFAKKVYLSLTS